MLLIQDATDKSEHNFALSSIDAIGQQHLFRLTSPTYQGVEIQLTLEPPTQILPPGYTVNVTLFKNPFHIQSQVIDLRTPDRLQGNGKIGYMFNLEALFTQGALQLDSHRYCYAYFGVEYLFRNFDSLQTKDAFIKADPYNITDFFDDDTIILVLCNEFCGDINDFKISDYLPNLFLRGFTKFSKDNNLETVNTHNYIRTNYNDITTPVSQNGVYPFRLEKAKKSICSEAYVIHLFTNLIQKKFDQVTRFLMLYQVVEIFMPKMIHLEVSQRLCHNLVALTTDKIKDLVVGLTKQNELITALLSRHAIPSHSLSVLLREEILNFFIHVNHPDYTDHSKHLSLSLTDLFYSFRNKIVHEYRILHEVGVDASVTSAKVDVINQLTEILVAETITVFVG